MKGFCKDGIWTISMCTFYKHKRFLKGRCQVLGEALRIGLQGVHETKILTCRRRAGVLPQFPTASERILPAASGEALQQWWERCRALS